MQLREIIFSVREDFHLMGDDSSITNEYIAYLIRSARSAIMQQRYSDPRNIIPAIEYQSFELAIGPNGISTSSIPSVIKTTGNPHASLKLYGVGVADTMLNIPLNVVSIERLPYVGHNPFTMDQIYCALDENGTIMMNSQNNLYKLIDKVQVRGIFEDPEAVYALTDYAKKYPNIDFYDTPYPLSDNVLMDVRSVVDKKMLQILQLPSDQLNDATEERLEQNPQGNK